MTIGRFRLSVTTDPRPVRASGLPADVEQKAVATAGAPRLVDFEISMNANYAI